MRVLVLATKYFGLGGAEAYTRMFTQALADGGADVETLSLLDGEIPDRAHPGRYLGHQGSRSTPWTQLRFAGRTIWSGRRHDLILCSHVAVAPLGMMLSGLFGTPYVVIGYGVDVWGDLGLRRKLALQKATRVIALSQFTARMLHVRQGVPMHQVSVVYPAVDPGMLALADADTPRADQGTLVLLTVGRLSTLERYKGCDTVIRALPAVREAVGPLRYVIVGHGDDHPRLEALAKDEGVASMTTFAGRATGPSLAEYYRASDIFVMPSTCDQWPTGWVGEGFGIVYIEAAAFGRPVVAGSGGGAPEAVQEGVTGVTVDGRDVKAVADALIRLGTDAGLRAKMGSAGRQWIRARFTYTRFHREVTAVVADVARVALRS